MQSLKPLIRYHLFSVLQLFVGKVLALGTILNFVEIEFRGAFRKVAKKFHQFPKLRTQYFSEKQLPTIEDETPTTKSNILFISHIFAQFLLESAVIKELVKLWLFFFDSHFLIISRDSGDLANMYIGLRT
eukprot:NP_491583.1 Uncharacterized protein CELE_C24A11.5 [Caenorhabditis elegans]